jgi:hypothetical protein
VSEISGPKLEDMDVIKSMTMYYFYQVRYVQILLGLIYLFGFAIPFTV